MNRENRKNHLIKATIKRIHVMRHSFAKFAAKQSYQAEQGVNIEITVLTVCRAGIWTSSRVTGRLIAAVSWNLSPFG